MGIKLLRLLNDVPEPKLDMVRAQGHALKMAFDKVAIIAGQLLAGAAGGEVFTQRCQDERLELGCGNTADRSGRVRFFLQHGLGDVIAVARAVLICVGRAHAVAALIKKAAGQEGGRAPQPAAPRHCLSSKLALHRVEQRGIENRLVLAAVNLASVNHLADIEAVLEQMRERAHAKTAPADSAAVR